MSAKQKSGDPYIRTVVLIAALAIIGGLLTIIFAWFYGVIDLDPERPQTVEEFAVAQANAFIGVEESAENYGRLAMAQTANNRFIEAAETIAMARELNFPDEERNQALEYAYADLALAQGDAQAAQERFENVMRQLRDAFDRTYNSDMTPNWAQAFGMHPNYYHSAFFLAMLYGDQGEYERKLEMLDVAVEGNPTAADILVDRGNTKLELGDYAGAAEDFTEALRFIPDDEAALTGLERAEGN